MLGEQLLRALHGVPPATGDSVPGVNPLRQAIEQAEIVTSGRGTENDVWTEMLSALPGELLAALERMAPMIPRQTMAGMPAAAGTLLAGEIFKALGADSSLGGDSLDSEVRRLVSHWTAFQSAQAQCGILLGQSAERALVQLSKRMGDPASDAYPVETVRAAYDLWIECSEDSYAELLVSEDFPNAHAAAINALVDLKSACSRLGSQVSAWLGAPSRAEHAALERRLHENRHQQRRHQQRLDEVLRRCASLEQRIQALEGASIDSTPQTGGESE